jgi:hypothetical protein
MKYEETGTFEIAFSLKKRFLTQNCPDKASIYCDILQHHLKIPEQIKVSP